jgi:hypothetical protein
MNLKQFCNVCYTNDVQDLESIQNWGYQKCFFELLALVVQIVLENVWNLLFELS